LLYAEEEMDNIVLTCPSTGSPKPLILWHYNGKIVQDGLKNRFIGFDGRLILTKVSDMLSISVGKMRRESSLFIWNLVHR